MPQHTIRARQVNRLTQLQNQRVRNQLLDNLLGRRRVASSEPAGHGGRRRPALAALQAQQRPGDRVAVSAAEVLVRGASSTAARADVDRELQGRPDVGSFQVHDVCEGIIRLELPNANSRDRALARLSAASVTASVNHVAMMGGTAKGGATPKATNGPVQSTENAPTSPPDGPLVVVIDTGIDRAAANRTDGWATFTAPQDPQQDFDPLDVLNAAGAVVVPPDGALDLAAGHGTFVAGIIGQVAPSADVVMVRALTTDGVCTEDQLVEAICRAAQVFEVRGRDRGVVNLSLGLETEDDQEPPILRAALDLFPEDVVVVAAAGNAPIGAPLWPAASTRACGVASLADAQTASAWSNFGDWVDFSARGEGIISTYVVGTETAALPGDVGSPFDTVPDTYHAPDPLAIWCGTSFSTPQVTGRLANIVENNPGFTRAQIISALEVQGSPLPNYGHRVPTL